MKHYVSANKSWIVISIIVFMFIICAWLFCSLAYPETSTHTIKSVEIVNDTRGDSDGIYTVVYYVVTTDKGMYHLKTSGINAAPRLVHELEVDSTYTLTSRGLNIPFFGMYKCFVH